MKKVPAHSRAEIVRRKKREKISGISANRNTYTETRNYVVKGTRIPVPWSTAKAFIQIPVVYRYHVRFDDPSVSVYTENRTLIVVVPPLEPTLPVAFRTEEVVSSIRKPPLIDDELLKELEESLSQRLELTAKSYLEAVRDKGRQYVAEFMNDLLIKTGSTSHASIKVYFSDEDVSKAFVTPIAPRFESAL